MRRLPIAAALFFVGTPLLFAQFEGVAEFQGSVHTAKSQTLPSHGKVFISKGAVRVEWETDLRQLMEEKKGGKGAAPQHFRMVMLQKLSEPDRTYIVNDEGKSYSIQKISKDTPSSPERTWKVQKLGRDTVAGLSCEKALLSSENGDQTEVCVTRELIASDAWLSAWNRREEQRTPLRALKDAGLDGFPVRWIFRGKGEKEAFSTVELVRFERKSLPASLFEIPAGYRQTDSSSVWGNPEQQKALRDARKKALENMTPEQRKKYEEMLKRQGQDPQQ